MKLKRTSKRKYKLFKRILIKDGMIGSYYRVGGGVKIKKTYLRSAPLPKLIYRDKS